MLQKIFFLFLISYFSISQNKQIEKLKIYLDCSYGCDYDFFQREMGYVDFYNDSKLANLHIIVKSQSNGSGGQSVLFRFIGVNEFLDQNNTLTLAVPPNSSENIKRSLYLSILEKGIYSYIIQTDDIDKVSVIYSNKNGLEENLSDDNKDKWNYWVFRLSASGYMSGEDGYKTQNYYSSVRINRITEASKFLSTFSYSNNLTEYNYDDLDLTTNRKSSSIYLTYVKSKGDYFSIGSKARYNQNTYSNLDASYTFSPCIEYNFFPYSESSEHRLSVLYGLSGTYNNYTDTTVYLKTTEFFPSHLIEFTYNNYQTWGSVNVSLDGMHILDKNDLKKFNLGLSTNIDWNITQGLSLSFWSWISLDRAQIELASSGATYEETILRQKELESSYFYSVRLGLSYTFGSLKNNFVNPRF